MTREYKDYVQDMLDAIRDIRIFICDMKIEEFVKDRKTINAVVRGLEVIGEAAKNVPQEVRDKRPAIPWKNLTGMRDKLIHAYFGVDTEIVWVMATQELPPLESAIEKLLSEL